MVSQALTVERRYDDLSKIKADISNRIASQQLTKLQKTARLPLILQRTVISKIKIVGLLREKKIETAGDLV